MSRVVIRISEEAMALVTKSAKASGSDFGEAADALIATGWSRRQALEKYKKAQGGEAKPKKVAKPKKEKAAKPRKAKKGPPPAMPDKPDPDASLDD